MLTNAPPTSPTHAVTSLFDFSNLIRIPENFSGMIFGALLVTVLATILCLVYRYTYAGKHFDMSFVQAFLLIAILLSFIMQIIGNSLARAFGMMGAVSIARFRTKVEDAKDTSFVLFSIGIGMACGLGHYLLAIFMTFFTSLIAILFYRFNHYFREPQTDILNSITIEVPDYSQSKELIESVLASSHVDFRLVDMEVRSNVRLIYNIRFRVGLGVEELAQSLRESLADRLLSFRWGTPLKISGSVSF